MVRFDISIQVDISLHTLIVSNDWQLALEKMFIEWMQNCKITDVEIIIDEDHEAPLMRKERR